MLGICHCSAHVHPEVTSPMPDCKLYVLQKTIDMGYVCSVCLSIFCQVTLFFFVGTVSLLRTATSLSVYVEVPAASSWHAMMRMWTTDVLNTYYFTCVHYSQPAELYLFGVSCFHWRLCCAEIARVLNVRHCFQRSGSGSANWAHCVTAIMAAAICAGLLSASR